MVIFPNCECGGERTHSGADIICLKCGNITPGVVFPSLNFQIPRFDPPAGFCVLCSGIAEIGGVYYHCKKCDTLGNIHKNGKVYAVSGTAEQLEETRRILEKRR